MTTQFPAAAALALAALLAASVAEAGPKGGNGNGNGRGHGAWAGGVFCPPGLRNRDPACVPPGQARHGDDDDEHEDDDREDDEDRDEDEVRRTDRQDAEDRGDVAERITDEVRDLVEGGGGLSDDQKQALAIIAGLSGLALAEQGRLPGLSGLLGTAEPTMARTAFPDPIPTRPAWIEALAYAPAAESAPTYAPAAPAPSTSLIPPPPPLADDVAGLLGREILDSGF